MTSVVGGNGKVQLWATTEEELWFGLRRRFQDLRNADSGSQTGSEVSLGGWTSLRDLKASHFQYVCQVAVVVLGASLKKTPAAFHQFAPVLCRGLNIGPLSPLLKLLGAS